MEQNKENLPDITEEQKKIILKSFLKKALENKVEKKLDNEDKIEILNTLKLRYEENNEFKVNDILIWKEQLKNRNFPDYNEPVILLELLDEPIFDKSEEIGSPYFNERNDIKVGVFRDNTMLVFYYDKQRFTKYITTANKV